MWFYGLAADQVISVGELPIGLSIPALVEILKLEGVHPGEWRRLVADVRMLFEVMVSEPARRKAKKAAAKARRRK